eukprot:scaffold141461_cov21-Tisochrysis_lutea.AAC.1
MRAWDADQHMGRWPEHGISLPIPCVGTYCTACVEVTFDKWKRSKQAHVQTVWQWKTAQVQSVHIWSRSMPAVGRLRACVCVCVYVCVCARARVRTTDTWSCVDASLPKRCVPGHEHWP